MRLPAHLRLSRHGVYYFRLVLPASLRPLFNGKREIKRSLATRDPKTAKIWAYSLYAAYQAALGETSKGMTKRKSAGLSIEGVNIDDLDSLNLNRFKVDIAKGIYESDPTVPGDAQAMAEFVKFLHETSPDLLKPPAPSPSPDPSETARLIKEAVTNAVSTPNPAAP
jgi:hypothetical protein